MNSSRQHLLVFRFSAMGDVALTVPVLRTILNRNPEIEITLVTRPRFLSFFHGIERLTVIGSDFKNRYKGFGGLIRLFFFLKKKAKYHAVVDLHSVIRSWILDSFFLLTGTPVSRIKKGRKEKRAFFKGNKKQSLPHTADRYLMAFRKVAQNQRPGKFPLIRPGTETTGFFQTWMKEHSIPDGVNLIGIAPLSKHKLKIWPVENYIELAEMINRHRDVYFLFFGGGEEEKSRIDSLIKRVPNSMNLAGILSLEQEMAVISRLKFMISMDSANMHISALLGTPTLSIWGGTHPAMGFSALNQPEEQIIQIPIEELSCRPCTVFGKGACHRGDFACMNRITPDMVYKKILRLKLLNL